MDFPDKKTIYRNYATSVYADAMRICGDPAQAKECLYQVFSRALKEDLSDHRNFEERLKEYTREYFEHSKEPSIDISATKEQMRRRSEERTRILRAQMAEAAARLKEKKRKEELLKGNSGNNNLISGAEYKKESLEEEEERKARQKAIEDFITAQIEALAIEQAQSDAEAEKDLSVADDEGIEKTRPLEMPDETEPVSEKQISEEIHVGKAEECTVNAGIPKDDERVVEKDKQREEQFAAELGPESQPDEESRGKKILGSIFGVVLAVAIILALWVLADHLMYHGIIPGSDLGYSWFNSHLIHIFPYPIS